MAVSRMRRVQILAHNASKEAIIAALRECGVIHITEPTSEGTDDRDDSARREALRALQTRLGKLEHIKDFLKPYVPKEKRSLEAMLNPRIVLDHGQLKATVERFDTDDWYARVIEVEGEMRSAEAEIARKESLAGEMRHWIALDAPIEEMTGTELAAVALLTVESSAVGSLREELAEAARESELFVVSESGSLSYLAVVYLREQETLVSPVLKRHGSRTAGIAGATGRPDEAARRLAGETASLREKIDALKRQATELAAERGNVLVVLDETRESLAKIEIEERFAGTRDTFMIEGWMRATDEDAVRERLGEITLEFEMVGRDPEKGEDVPIDLSNGPVVHPFEFVTTLYGRPSYKERDPTPLLAPFFILFFGLCVSDAGYGVTLAAVSFFFMTRMQPGGGRQLMKLLMMGGISTAVVGAVTGGWFGLHSHMLPAWLRTVIVMNPLQEPMKMLNVVFILGIVQVITGLIIKMASDVRQRQWAAAVLDQLVWVFFLIFLVPLGYAFILGGRLPAGVMAVSKNGAMAAGAIVVLTGARSNKNPAMKLLGGVLKLYDVVGYFGDVLSYARLLALGLATGAIAMAINGVADMATGIPIVGPVAAVVILVGGHLFNMAVNCLGGFVHSARLQYLEFFSKFFTGGGRAFAPFRVEKRYSAVRK